MQINYNRENEKLTVAPEGRIDTMTAPEFEKKVSEIITNDTTDLVLDMTNVEYVSSAGLRVILKLQKIMFNMGKMTVTGVNETIMEVFEITGFADILNIQ